MSRRALIHPLLRALFPFMLVSSERKLITRNRLDMLRTAAAETSAVVGNLLLFCSSSFLRPLLDSPFRFIFEDIFAWQMYSSRTIALSARQIRLTAGYMEATTTAHDSIRRARMQPIYVSTEHWCVGTLFL